MNQYADRDHEALDKAGGFYLRHVSAMTREGLHSKADIAAELGWRDMLIASLEEQVVQARRTSRTPAGMSEPDYWPSAKVTVHEDEVRPFVNRVTAELYAPGLPPGTYDLYLPETQGHPAVPPSEEQKR